MPTGKMLQLPQLAHAIIQVTLALIGKRKTTTSILDIGLDISSVVAKPVEIGSRLFNIFIKAARS